MLCVPGGVGVNALMEDEAVLAFLRRQSEGARYVTSVCTGALVLAAAGLLTGRRATTHWASHDFLARLGAIPEQARVVVDGRFISGGGVTAGIDMALTLTAELLGREQAEAIQLKLEYAPAPPFAAGQPETAPAGGGGARAGDRQRRATRSGSGSCGGSRPAWRPSGPASRAGSGRHTAMPSGSMLCGRFGRMTHCTGISADCSPAVAVEQRLDRDHVVGVAVDQHDRRPAPDLGRAALGAPISAPEKPRIAAIGRGRRGPTMERHHRALREPDQGQAGIVEAVARQLRVDEGVDQRRGARRRRPASLPGRRSCRLNHWRP